MGFISINNAEYLVTDDELDALTPDLNNFTITGSAHLRFTGNGQAIDIRISNGTVITTSRN